jgi:hypothetical protein
MPEQNERKGSKESEPPDNGKGDSEVVLYVGEQFWEKTYPFQGQVQVHKYDRGGACCGAGKELNQEQDNSVQGNNTCGK